VYVFIEHYCVMSCQANKLVRTASLANMAAWKVVFIIRVSICFVHHFEYDFSNDNAGKVIGCV
jgi:hypothetical protein